MMNAHGCVKGLFVLFFLRKGGEGWWVLVNGGKRGRMGWIFGIFRKNKNK
jgi:hypothetical protein